MQLLAHFATNINREFMKKKHTLRYLAGPFFYNRTDRVFFRALARKTKTKNCHTEPGRYDGHQQLWLFLLPVGVVLANVGQKLVNINILQVLSYRS